MARVTGEPGPAGWTRRACLAGLLTGPLALLPRSSRAIEAAGPVEILAPTLLRLPDGSLLRLAGLEAALPEHEAARAAALRALSDLIEGEVLVFEPEVPTSDRLGRALVQAFRSRDRLWLQGRMLRWGLARVDPFTAPYESLQAFYALESEARAEGVGLWSHPAYRLRSSEPAALLPWIGSLQVFEGVVLEVGGRSDIYLNFGEDWASDTTARIPRASRKRFEAAGIDPESLAGRRVRLRGWLQKWNGPFLELHSPAQMEILDSP